MARGVSELATFIKDVGFPVFVAVYLLLRVDVLLRRLIEAVAAVRAAVVANGAPPPRPPAA